MERETSPKYWLKDVLVIAGLTFAAIWFCWPLLQDPARKLMDDYDGMLIAWTQATVSQHLIPLNVHDFFDGHIFYPATNTLAFSDLYLTGSLLSLPVWLTTHEPVALVTTNTILAQILLLLSLYFLVHELTHDRWLAAAASLVYGFSRWHLVYIGSLHTFQVAGIPLVWLSLLRLSQKPSIAWLLVLFGSFWFQFFNNFLSGWFILLTLCIWLLGSPKTRVNLIRLWRWMITGIAVTVMAAMPIILPYVQITHQYHYVRPITDVINFSLSPEQLATTFASPLLYALLALGLLIPKKAKWNTWAAMSITAIILALGPALHWLGKTVKLIGIFGLPPIHIPLPYLLLYYLLPGFQGFRTPSRWLTVAGMALVVWGASQLTHLPQVWRRLAATGLIIATLCTTRQITPLPVPAVNEYPPVYTWLKSQPGKVVVELPIFRWGSDQFAKNEAWRMLYQTYHGKTLVNGYSGFDPAVWEGLVNRLQNDFPSFGMMSELKRMGVDYVIVHQDEYLKWRGQTISIGLQPIYNQDQTLVYQID